MSANYPRYEKYKATWVEWLPQVPLGWVAKRLKYLFLDGYDGLKIGPFGSQIKSNELTEKGYRIYGQENAIKSDFTLGKRFISESKFNELKVYELKPKDIVITMMGTTGKCEIVPDNIDIGIMDSHLIRLRLRPELIGNGFFQYLINDSNYISFQLKLFGKGSIMHGLNSSIIKDLYSLLPPLPEQKAIAAFLDDKTGKIDALLAKLKRQKELLTEKRTALITRAVTRGLNPDTPMKETGIEWLPQVPLHWEVKRLKFVASFNSGESITSDTINEAGEYAVYGGNGLRGYTSSYTHDGHFALIGRQGALCGNINYAKGKFWASEHAVVATLVSGYNVFWFGEILRVMNLNQYSQSAAQPGLAVDYIKNLFIPVPPKDEQKEIAKYIEAQTAKIDLLQSKTDKQIELLKEYRTSLITSAVTGQIKVTDNQQQRLSA